MKKLRVIDLLQSTDYNTTTEIKGWVRTKRGNKQVAFIAVNDGSTINNIQLVVDLSNFSEETLKPITTGACIHAKGLLVQSQGQGQTVEIQVSELRNFKSVNIKPQYFAFVTIWLLPSTNISTTADSFICIRRSSQVLMLKVQEKCFV